MIGLDSAKGAERWKRGRYSSLGLGLSAPWKLSAPAAAISSLRPHERAPGGGCGPGRNVSLPLGVPARLQGARLLRALPGKHLNFASSIAATHHRTVAAGRVARITGSSLGGGPVGAWPGSRFTLLFEHDRAGPGENKDAVAGGCALNDGESASPTRFGCGGSSITMSAGPSPRLDLRASVRSLGFDETSVQAPPQLGVTVFIDMDRREGKPGHLRHARQGQGLCGRVPGLHAGP